MHHRVMISLSRYCGSPTATKRTHPGHSMPTNPAWAFNTNEPLLYIQHRLTQPKTFNTSEPSLDIHYKRDRDVHSTQANSACVFNTNGTIPSLQYKAA